MSGLHPYVELVSSFIHGELGAAEFERRFSERYLNDETLWPEEEFLVLDGLFGDADAFVEDPALRAGVKHALDESELRSRAEQALATLRALERGQP